MKTSLKLVLSAIAIGLLSTAFIPQAGAAEINGNIDFGVGTVTYDTTSLATATQVSTWTNAHVTLATGSFAGFQVTTPGSPGDAGSLATPWIFNSGPPGSPLPGPATNPLWSVDGFSFALAMST